MPNVQKRTFSLTEEQSNFIDRKVASGEYASGSEVIRAGLRGMEEEEAVLEKWLREEVVPAIDELEAHPELARSVDEVFEEILADLRPKEQKTRRRA